MATRYASGRREGITEELVAALADYERGPFTAREKAALRYADRLFVDHHRVDDALWDALGDVFTEEERLELTWVLSEFIGLGKAKTDRLMALCRRAPGLAVVLDNEVVARELSIAGARHGVDVRFLVECDTGFGRTGVQTPAAAFDLARLAARLPRMQFR